MLSFLKHLAQRWNDWCGDHDMEMAIRRHLSDNGYFGKTAKLRNVRLIAVQRPGWLQISRFEATARLQVAEIDDGPPADAVYRDLYGLVKDDIRQRVNTVRIFDCADERKELFGRWSEDLICLRGAQGLR